MLRSHPTPRPRRWQNPTVLLIALASLACSSFETSAPPTLPDPLAAGWDGQPVCEELANDANHRVLRCTFPPGIGHERHYHAPHFGYVLVGGRMRITDSEGTREVDLPDHLTWDSDGVGWHEVLNVGDTTSVYLIVEPTLRKP